MPDAVTVAVVEEARTRDLRRRVLRPGLDVRASLPGDEVIDGVHLGAMSSDGDVVGTCFVYPAPCPWLPDLPAWRLRQMATDARWRGGGVGAAVLGAAVAHVATEGAIVLWCAARASAAGFYARSGFVAAGPEYVDAATGLPHVHMALVLRGGGPGGGGPGGG